MTSGLSDEQIKEAIIARVSEVPDRRYGSDGEFASSLGLQISNTRVKRVLGRMIEGREVIRHRGQHNHPDSYIERPVIFRLLSARITS